MSVSVVIPCLNEEGSLAECIRLIKNAFKDETDLEIIVADNGSTDRSREIAMQAAAKVFEERRRGYGSAILRGLKEARGEFVVIGDADNTYDFEDGAKLVSELKKGADFAIGNRLKGPPDPGAMPWLHQHLGTPALSWVLSRFFGCRVHDINCGLRAIRKSCLKDLKLRSPGMEFASEMVIHAQKAGLRFAEIPIRYYVRHHGQAKLRTFRDGWRHLRFILLCAPFPLFVIPAIFFAVASAFSFADPRFGFQVIGCLLSLVAVQIFLFALFAKAHLWISDSFMIDRPAGRLIQRFQLEFGILASLLLFLGGILFFYFFDLRNLIRGATLIAVGVQVLFSSFLLSIILSKPQSEN